MGLREGGAVEIDWGRRAVAGSKREDGLSCCSSWGREVGDENGRGWVCLVSFLLLLF